ncbi:MAG: hypothetical protein CSA34_07570 [Desulfobulbus propionicus]|nr:MAG: hypothetical protein CSA34_07570 [Desulfobulbus propionicus]
MVHRHFIRQNFLLGAMTFVLSIAFACISPSMAAPQAEEAAMPIMIKDESSQKPPGEYEYALDDRPDPFKPFIAPQETSQPDPNEIVEEEKELRGMQLFEPGQLRLVATVLREEGDNFAMAEDVTGRGYPLEEGMLIGRRGQVTSITPQEVLITETAKTRAGKELITTVVMRLKNEGDE